MCFFSIAHAKVVPAFVDCDDRYVIDFVVGESKQPGRTDGAFIYRFSDYCSTVRDT